MLDVTSQTVPVGEIDAIVPSILENNVMSTPVSARPKMCGVVTFVLLSIFEVPESLEARRSRENGVDGAVASIVIVSPPESMLGPLPNWSVWEAVI